MSERKTSCTNSLSVTVVHVRVVALLFVTVSQGTSHIHPTRPVSTAPDSYGTRSTLPVHWYTQTINTDSLTVTRQQLDYKDRRALWMSTQYFCSLHTSCLVSMTRIPILSHATRIGEIWPPARVNRYFIPWACDSIIQYTLTVGWKIVYRVNNVYQYDS